MTLNECYIEIPGLSQIHGFKIKIFESEVGFTHRAFFEHKHSDFEISYIKSGKGIYNLKDQICQFDTGDIFIFGTNVIHCITDTVADEKTTLLNIQFEPRLIWSPFSNILTDESRSIFNGKKERISFDNPIYNDIANIILKIHTEASNKDTGYEILIRAYLCEIIGLLVREYKADTTSQNVETQKESLVNLELSMAYINENLDKKLSLEEIAHVAGFSRTYFSSIFTKFNGLSPWEYITIRRIEKSKHLLKYTSHPIILIAQNCGFSNLSNFNRLFLRIVGTSPSKYRASFKS